MRTLLFVMALCACSSASAAIVNYSWDARLTEFVPASEGGPYGITRPAKGLFSFDTDTRALISASIQSESVIFAWTGFSEVNVQGISDLQEESIAILDFWQVIGDTGFSLFLYFENFTFPLGEDPYFGNAGLYEGAAVFEGGTHHLMDGGFVLESVVEITEVPEPSPIALLGLGLLSLPLTRRRRYA